MEDRFLRNGMRRITSLKVSFKRLMSKNLDLMLNSKVLVQQDCNHVCYCHRLTVSIENSVVLNYGYSINIHTKKTTCV